LAFPLINVPVTLMLPLTLLEATFRVVRLAVAAVSVPVTDTVVPDIVAAVRLPTEALPLVTNDPVVVTPDTVDDAALMVLFTDNESTVTAPVEVMVVALMDDAVSPAVTVALDSVVAPACSVPEMTSDVAVTLERADRPVTDRAPVETDAEVTDVVDVRAFAVAEPEHTSEPVLVSPDTVAVPVVMAPERVADAAAIVLVTTKESKVAAPVDVRDGAVTDAALSPAVMTADARVVDPACNAPEITAEVDDMLLSVAKPELDSVPVVIEAAVTVVLETRLFTVAAPVQRSDPVLLMPETVELPAEIAPVKLADAPAIVFVTVKESSVAAPVDVIVPALIDAACSAPEIDADDNVVAPACSAPEIVAEVALMPPVVSDPDCSALDTTSDDRVDEPAANDPAITAEPLVSTPETSAVDAMTSAVAILPSVARPVLEMVCADNKPEIAAEAADREVVMTADFRVAVAVVFRVPVAIDAADRAPVADKEDAVIAPVAIDPEVSALVMVAVPLVVLPLKTAVVAVIVLSTVRFWR
jgi:hypothetical protein